MDINAKINEWNKILNDSLNKFIDTIKNYPPDKQAAVGAIVLGVIFVIVSLFLI